MAVNSICWQMPSNFRFYSHKIKRKIRVQPVLVEFRRLLESKITAVEGVSNQELLHAVVALYDHCLPEITPEVLYATVCGKWAKTLILLRNFQDVLQELKGLSSEDDGNGNIYIEKEKIIFADQFNENKLSDDERYQSETKATISSTCDSEILDESISRQNVRKQVSWSDKLNIKDNDAREKTETVCEKCTSQISCCRCDSAVGLASSLTEDSSYTHPIPMTKDEDVSKEKEDPRKFDGVFSDTDDSEASAASDDEEEDFSKGAEGFVEAAKKRRTERQSGSDNVSCKSLGIESLIVGAATYERSYSITRHKPSEKVMQLNLLAVRKRCRKSGVGKFLLETLKDPTVIGPYDTIAVFADNDAVDFFKRNGFTDDVVLCSRFSELTDHWINSILMCYLPPFTGSDYSDVFRSEEELKEMDDEIKKWREKSLEAYQAQTTCMVRLQHEIKTLKAMVDTQDEAIKTLTNAKERLEKEKYQLEKELLGYKMKDQDGVLSDQDYDDDEDVYEALAQMLSKKHMADPKLDLEAISQGDFRDVPEGDEDLVSSFITSHSERQLVQQIKQSLISSKNYSNVKIDSIIKVESCHVAFMETSFDSRTQKLGDPVMCMQLYFCGGSDEEQIRRIMKRGFTKQDFTRSSYGKGLYFSMHACQAALFSAPGKLLLANVGLGLTESVVVQDRTRELPPAGFDSILTSGRVSSPVLRHTPQQEYVVFDPLQVMRRYSGDLILCLVD